MLEAKLEEILEWLINLGLFAKEAHWNLRGPEFFYAHPMFDELHSDVNGYADLIAERARATELYLGPKISYAMSKEAITFSRAVNFLKGNLKGLQGTLNSAILNTDDLATQDTLIEVKRGIDKWLWMFSESSR